MGASILSLLHGWISGNWQKQPLLFGYSGKLLGRLIDPDLGAGGNTLLSGAVPAGEIWVFTSLAMYYSGTVPTEIYTQVRAGGADRTFFNQFTPVSGDWYDRQGMYILEEGDKLSVAVAGATVGDMLILDYTGYRVDIDQ